MDQAKAIMTLYHDGLIDQAEAVRRIEDLVEKGDLWFSVAKELILDMSRGA